MIRASLKKQIDYLVNHTLNFTRTTSPLYFIQRTTTRRHLFLFLQRIVWLYLLGLGAISPEVRVIEVLII